MLRFGWKMAETGAGIQAAGWTSGLGGHRGENWGELAAPACTFASPWTHPLAEHIYFSSLKRFPPPPPSTVSGRILESDSSSASNKCYKDVLPACILFYTPPAPRPVAPGSCAGEIKSGPVGQSGDKAFFPRLFNKRDPPPRRHAHQTLLKSPSWGDGTLPISAWGGGGA